MRQQNSSAVLGLDPTLQTDQAGLAELTNEPALTNGGQQLKILSLWLLENMTSRRSGARDGQPLAKNVWQMANQALEWGDGGRDQLACNPVFIGN